MMREADIIINGMELTTAQAFTLRVAMMSFHNEMAEDGALGDDEGGKALASAYHARAGEIVALILRRAR